MLKNRCKDLKLAGFSGLIVFLLALAPLRSQAQGEIRPTFGAEFSMNFNDHFFGLSGGITLDEWRLSALFDFNFRLFAKRVQVEGEDNFVFQYWERRYLPMIGLNWRIKAADISSNLEVGPMVALRGAFSFGDYRGSNETPPANFLFNPRAGVWMGDDGLFLQLGYQYLPTNYASIANSRVFLSIHGMF